MKIIKIVRHATSQLEEDISDNSESCATSDIIYRMKIIRICVILSDSKILMKILRIVEFEAFQLEQDISDISDSSAISDSRYEMKIVGIVGLEISVFEEDINGIMKIVVQYPILDMKRR